VSAWIAAVVVAGLAVQPYDKDAYGRTVTDCDRLAAYAPDHDRIAPPIAREQVDVPRAVQACEAALATEPANPRLHYQLARVLTYAGDRQGAQRHRQIAAAAGYPSALFLLGYQKAYPTDGAADRCGGAALLQMSARAGALASQVALVSGVLDGTLRDCSAAGDRAELGRFLDHASKGAEGYFETLLVKNLVRDLEKLPVAAPTDDPTRNASVERWTRGAYQYRSLVDARLRGRETFLLTVHPDGSRTMRAFTDIFARGVTANVVLRADAGFRPLDAYVSVLTQGRLKGSAFFALDGQTLHSSVEGPGGRVNQSENVPADLSFATHPLALDGFHAWLAPGKPGEVRHSNLLNIQADADFSRPMLGKVQSVAIEYRGEEDVVVPAGTFRAHHFVMDDSVELWVTLPEHLLVRSAWPKYGSEYVLSELESSPTGRILETRTH
jgi:hypothetical protein